MTSIARNKSKSRSKKTRESIMTDEKIDQIMKDITLKRPRNPYTQFFLSEVASYKTKNKDAKIDLQEFGQTCAEKWKKMKDGEKKKYSKQFEDEKVKYKSDIELVRHYLFRDFNDTISRSPTAYRIFLNERLREGFEQNLDPKDVRKEAGSKWAQMTEEEKKVYVDKKKENDNWFIKAEKIRKITPIALFIQKKIQEAKEKHKEPPALKEIAPAWKKLPKNEKKSFEKYAQELNEEKEKLKDIYDIVHGVKPKKPAGAFRIFLQEKAKNNEIKTLKEGQELWKKLSEDQKEEYLTKSHKCLLAYRYKKMIYNKKIKKMLPKKPKGPLQQFLKEKKKDKSQQMEKAGLYFGKLCSMAFLKLRRKNTSKKPRKPKKNTINKCSNSKTKYLICQKNPIPVSIFLSLIECPISKRKSPMFKLPSYSNKSPKNGVTAKMLTKSSITKIPKETKRDSRSN
jgi:hypothetical protein